MRKRRKPILILPNPVALLPNVPVQRGGGVVRCNGLIGCASLMNALALASRNRVMFMHDYPLAVYFAQTDGQTKLEFDSLPVLLCTATPHQSSDIRNVVARRNVHFNEIEDHGIIGPREEEIPSLFVRIDSLRL